MIGRSRGGLSTKIHATCDAMGNPTGFSLTPGQACDLDGADALIGEIDAAILIADKGYDPAYGARPLKRVIQTELQNKLAELILEGRAR